MTSSADLVKEATASFQKLSPMPRLHTAIVTCFDTRLDPLRILRAEAGDLHIFRNAGGIVTEDVMRSLIVSTHRLGVTRVHLIMHTDCGMLNLDQREIEAKVGRLPIELGGFSDLNEELARGAELIRAETRLHLPGGVETSIYDVDQGRLVSQRL